MDVIGNIWHISLANIDMNRTPTVKSQVGWYVPRYSKLSLKIHPGPKLLGDCLQFLGSHWLELWFPPTTNEARLCLVKTLPLRVTSSTLSAAFNFEYDFRLTLILATFTVILSNFSQGQPSLDDFFDRQAAPILKFQVSSKGGNQASDVCWSHWPIPKYVHWSINCFHEKGSNKRVG